MRSWVQRLKVLWGPDFIVVLCTFAEEILTKVDSLRKSNKEIERNRRAVSSV